MEPTSATNSADTRIETSTNGLAKEYEKILYKMAMGTLGKEPDTMSEEDSSESGNFYSKNQLDLSITDKLDGPSAEYTNFEAVGKDLIKPLVDQSKKVREYFEQVKDPDKEKATQLFHDSMGFSDIYDLFNYEDTLGCNFRNNEAVKKLFEGIRKAPEYEDLKYNLQQIIKKSPDMDNLGSNRNKFHSQLLTEDYMGAINSLKTPEEYRYKPDIVEIENFSLLTDFIGNGEIDEKTMEAYTKKVEEFLRSASKDKRMIVKTIVSNRLNDVTGQDEYLRETLAEILEMANGNNLSNKLETMHYGIKIANKLGIDNTKDVLKKVVDYEVSKLDKTKKGRYNANLEHFDSLIGDW